MTEATIKAAIIEPVGGHCGMDYYDFGLAGGLAAAGVDVVLHTCDETREPPGGGYEMRYTYRAIYGEAPAWLRGLRYFRGSVAAMLSAVIEGRRIVHLHMFHVSVPEFFNVCLARLLRRKVIITAHDVESFVRSLERPLLRRFVYRLSNAVIAHNRISRKELVENVGVDDGKTHIIRHGNFLDVVDPLPDAIEARRRLGVPEHARVILYFGQIKQVKGVDILLRALPRVIERFPDAVLLLGGKPWKMNFSEYQKIIDDLGIGAHCIKHMRFIGPDNLPYFFAASDIVVLPYRRIYQSGVVLLSMTYRKPVIAADLPGMVEIFTDGVDGYLFKREDPEALGQRLCEAFEDDAARAAVAEAGFRRVRDHYDWNHTGRATRRLYEEVLR